jgi:hypothetical protein
MTSIFRVLAGTTLAAFLTLSTATAPARAQAGFDGLWSVLIATQSGPCDAAYRYPVRISGGRVSYAGGGSFTISGRVSGNGAVSVTVKRGNQSASGTGRLSRTSGSGRWRGRSSSSACAGNWSAERRG